MKRTLLAALVLAGAIATASSAAESQAKSKKSVDAVYAVGCISEEDGKWMLIRATDAVVTEISPLTPDEEKAADALETPGTTATTSSVSRRSSFPITKATKSRSRVS